MFFFLSILSQESAIRARPTIPTQAHKVRRTTHGNSTTVRTKRLEVQMRTTEDGVGGRGYRMRGGGVKCMARRKRIEREGGTERGGKEERKGGREGRREARI